MPDYAVPRPGYNGEPFAEWLTRQLQQNPRYVLPAGWKNDNGRAVRDTHSGMDDFITKGLPAIGFGAAGGIGAAGALGGGAAGASMPATVAGIPAGSTFGGAAGGGGLMASMKPWLSLGSQLLPMAGSLMSNDDGRTPMDDELERLLQMQNSRMQSSEPLYQAILKMAMGMLPRSVQGTPRG